MTDSVWRESARARGQTREPVITVLSEAGLHYSEADDGHAKITLFRVLSLCLSVSHTHTLNLMET